MSAADPWKSIDDLRQGSLGRLLLRASRRYNEAAIQRVRSLGHPDLTIAHAAILPHIDRSGTRLTDLADRAGMSKQAASELVSALERLGYLTRQPDPDDRRAQRVSFTSKGEDFLQAAHMAKLALENEVVELLGPTDAARFLDALRRLID